jgi:Domain of unknown function (DUF4258)
VVGGIDLEDVREVVTGGERIEEYLDDHPYPSALLLGWPGGRPVHVVAAYDPPETIYVVTCYHPEAEQWDSSWPPGSNRTGTYAKRGHRVRVAAGVVWQQARGAA